MKIGSRDQRKKLVVMFLFCDQKQLFIKDLPEL